MNREDLKTAIAACLEEAVPEADAASLGRSVSLRDQLDIDSMDMLRFLRALHAATGVDIPEKDTRLLETLDGALEYLSTRLPS
jgi:acyl carrier protein